MAATARFTDKFISNLKPKGIRYDLREGSGTGFAVRVATDGVITFCYWYTLHGRKRRMSLGQYPTLSLKDARALRDQAAALVARGIDPLTQRRETAEAARRAHEQDRRDPSIKTLAEEYIEHYAKPNKTSWRQDQLLLSKHVVSAWGSHKAREITRRDVLLLLDKIKGRSIVDADGRRGWSGHPVTANRVQGVLSTLFNFAVQREVRPDNPVHGIKPVPEAARERALSDEEIPLFWHGLDGASMAPLDRIMLRLILLTGVRPGEEITAAEWAEFDLEAAIWTIPGERIKTEKRKPNPKPHRVPLSSLALELVVDARERSFSKRWVFPSSRRDAPIHRNQTNILMRRAFARGAMADLEVVQPHDLRRTLRTGMERLGIDPVVSERILNHALPVMVRTYNRHDYLPQMRTALETWGEHVRALVTGETATPSNVVSLR